MNRRRELARLSIGLWLLASSPPGADAAMALPVGDGKVSAAPTVGYVYACQTHFGQGGGAFRDGPWLRGGFWYPDEKISVSGAVDWPSARIEFVRDGDRRAWLAATDCRRT